MYNMLKISSMIFITVDIYIFFWFFSTILLYTRDFSIFQSPIFLFFRSTEENLHLVLPIHVPLSSVFSNFSWTFQSWKKFFDYLRGSMVVISICPCAVQLLSGRYCDNFYCLIFLIFFFNYGMHWVPIINLTF